LYLGIIGAGARFTGINPAYSAHEVTHHMSMTKAKAMIVEPQMLETALISADECGIARSMVFVFDVHAPNTRSDLQTWSSLLAHGESEFVRCGDPATTIASYQTSSGTSGLPKAAMIPHAYLIAQAKLRISEPSIKYKVCSLDKVILDTATDFLKVRRLTALPPMHVFATPIVPASIRQGCEVYIMRRYEMSSFIQAIERFEISETYLPPPPLIAIPNSPLATKQAMKSIRQIWMGGAGVTYPNQLPMYSILHPDARVNQCWGMTEVGWVTTIKWPHKQQDDSVGTPLSGYAIRYVNRREQTGPTNSTDRLVDDDGKIITKPSTRGEVQILAPHPMLGYLNNPEANASAFTVDSKGRWVNSGDIAHMNERGNLFIVDRKKDLVKVRGWQVSPAEVEARLIQHPDILDAGVIGLPLPNSMGDVVRAYVVARDGR
jgi:4-coumarate--CoA ligase